MIRSYVFVFVFCFFCFFLVLFCLFFVFYFFLFFVFVFLLGSDFLTLNIAAGLPVFSNTAIDIFGPLQIRINRKTLKEAQEIIFTCKSGPFRACNRQLIYGFSEICLTQMISQ